MGWWGRVGGGGAVGWGGAQPMGPRVSGARGKGRRGGKTGGWVAWGRAPYSASARRPCRSRTWCKGTGRNRRWGPTDTSSPPRAGPPTAAAAAAKSLRCNAPERGRGGRKIPEQGTGGGSPIDAAAAVKSLQTLRQRGGSRGYRRGRPGGYRRGRVRNRAGLPIAAAAAGGFLQCTAPRGWTRREPFY